MFVNPNDLNYIVSMLLILGGVFLYQRWAEHNAIVAHPHSHTLVPRERTVLTSDITIQEYLKRVHHSMLGGNGPEHNKPIMWIHVEREWNAREWSHFMSRGSEEVNQPYMYLTISSILNACGDHFNVAIIDDYSFRKILPNWTVGMEHVNGPVRHNLRRIAIAQLLYMYGGITIPASSVCLRSLAQIHANGISGGNTMYLGEFAASTNYLLGAGRDVESARTKLAPDTRFMGCTPKSRAMLGLVYFLKNNQHASESEFLESHNRFCEELIHSNQATLLDGRIIGTRTAKGTPVSVHELMGDTYIEYDNAALHCICVPHEAILAMPKYQWFAYLSTHQVLQSSTMIGKWLAMANKPISLQCIT